MGRPDTVPFGITKYVWPQVSSSNAIISRSLRWTGVDQRRVDAKLRPGSLTVRSALNAARATCILNAALWS